MAIGLAIAKGLDSLHTMARVLHLDKPQNVLLDAHKDAVLTDFGISHRIQETMTAYQPTHGGVLGTPNYVSPEASGALGDTTIGRPADVWSLAATLVHMLSGKPPYDGRSTIQILTALIHQQAPAPLSR
ncbi:hypothetical protein WJX73_008266 [Symbiochloris irregularis]|uniref:non-specific serine/threonine protein kinase n=1 Tax=Symbiochloris irregularis TaxID=706552 RepID=A0AAW1PSE6_9CHLO